MSAVAKNLEKKEKHPRRKKTVAWLFFFLAMVALTAISGLASYNYVIEKSAQTVSTEPVKVDPKKGVYIEIPLGSGTEAIAKLLKEKGIIQSPYLFKILSMINGYDGTYRSGTHLVSSDLKYEEIMRVLSGKPITVRVTIPEGYNVVQMTDVFIKNGLIADKESFLQAVEKERFSYKFLEGLPKRENRLEGYLFPDTYEFDLHAGAKEIIDAMLRNFNNKFKPEYYEKAEKMGMTADQIIILASIIEREARVAEERDIISAVFHNRLKHRDKTLQRLESCATIQYIYYMRDGIIKEKITEEDTKVDSPYNTYKIEGLPPGPICCPGEDAIKAALFPDTEVDYLYFVARGDGTHQFSRTYSQHQAAMKKYGVK